MGTKLRVHLRPAPSPCLLCFELHPTSRDEAASPRTAMALETSVQHLLADPSWTGSSLLPTSSPSPLPSPPNLAALPCSWSRGARSSSRSPASVPPSPCLPSRSPCRPSRRAKFRRCRCIPLLRQNTSSSISPASPSAIARCSRRLDPGGIEPEDNDQGLVPLLALPRRRSMNPLLPLLCLQCVALFLLCCVKETPDLVSVDRELRLGHSHARPSGLPIDLGQGPW